MDYDSDLCLLSSKFTQDYPLDTYPEIMHKQGRPYTCLLIDMHDDFFICIPFRSGINHNNAFLFTNTVRSQKSSSGLDYSKIIIIKDLDYIDSSTPAIVDQDEYREMIKNLPRIVKEATEYVNTYINHISGTAPIHPRQYKRKYRFSTLPYFNSIMGL